MSKSSKHVLVSLAAGDLLAPRRNLVLQPADQGGQSDTERHEDQYGDEKTRRVEVVAGFQDDAAKAGDRRKELRYHHGDDRPADGEPQASHDERQGRRDDDLPRDRGIRGDERLAD